MSNVGKWNRWYSGLRKGEPQAYGDTSTYQLGADWLKDCVFVEDWGCGKGWFSRFIPAVKYRGIDGSHSPFAENIVDLVNYQSDVPGIFMRHVIEHNYEWKSLLTNALNSFSDRMVLVLFTPLVEETKELYYNVDPGVPDMAFSLKDLQELFDATGVTCVRMEAVQNHTNYGEETIFYLEKTKES
jgi:hypothetical protein